MTDIQNPLPNDLDYYFLKLELLYSRNNSNNLLSIISNHSNKFISDYSFEPEYKRNCYLITIELSEDYCLTFLKELDTLSYQIQNDLNLLIPEIQFEISGIYIKTIELSKQEIVKNLSVFKDYQEDTFCLKPALSLETINTLWGEDNSVKIFISHTKDIHDKAVEVKTELEKIGFKAFVADIDLDGSGEWRNNLKTALLTMDVFVSMININYKNSEWANSEMGAAFGRCVPCVFLKLDRTLPNGIFDNEQGNIVLDELSEKDIALLIFRKLTQKLPQNELLFQIALEHYQNTPSWDGYDISCETLKSYFCDYPTLTKQQVKRIIQAYNSNDQNYGSGTGGKILYDIISKCTDIKLPILDSSDEEHIYFDRDQIFSISGDFIFKF